MPHGYCYMWNPGLVWPNVISDSLIAIVKPDVPIIFATGYSPEIELLQEVQRQGLSILQKPYVPRELARKVCEVLDRSAAKAQRL